MLCYSNGTDNKMRTNVNVSVVFSTAVRGRETAVRSNDTVPGQETLLRRVPVSEV